MVLTFNFSRHACRDYSLARTVPAAVSLASRATSSRNAESFCRNFSAQLYHERGAGSMFDQSTSIERRRGP